jgi:hypothetical protein
MVVVSRYAEDESKVQEFQIVDERVVDEASRGAAERAVLESAEGHLLRASLDEEIELLVLYLPSPTEMPEHADQEKLGAGAEIMQLTGEDLDLLGTMADRYLEDVAALGVSTIDLRPSFRSLEGQLYRVRDLHLNLAGHRAAADVSAPWIEARWDAWNE